MRIRKRKVPLPLSLLSPVPLTDPHLFSRSPVQLDHDFTTPTCSSDHFSSRTCHSDTSASDLRHLLVAPNTTPPNVSLTVTGVKGVQMGNNDGASNASIKSKGGAPAYDNDNDNDNNKGPLMSPLSNNEGRWCDGDRAIPLKKRRTMIMKCDFDKGSTPTSDQTASVIINDDNGGHQEEVGVAATSSAKKGNSKRGNTIMEGSRCSRVNGRGWRCCQPTLVGYSLCEHHLGKGRLRSMTSTVKARSSSLKNKNANNNNNNSFGTNHKFALGSHDGEKETVDNNNNNEKKMERTGSFGNSKRAKLGVVKARSLSSLLGQTNSMSMSNNIVSDHANMHQQENISN